MSEREKQINQFLDAQGWGKAKRMALPGDASSRRYEKLNRDGELAVLMDAPSTKAPVTELQSLEQERADKDSRDYAQIAKLADGEMSAFTAIADALSQRGFRAPKIIGVDIEAGLLLLEDLGDNLIARAIEKDPSLEAEIYKAAVECLGAIYRSSFPKTLSAHGHDWALRRYDDEAMHAEVSLMLEWYLPYKGGELPFDKVMQWRSIWTRAFAHLQAHPAGLVLRDYHAENIFWLEGTQVKTNSAIDKIGLIDFQDGLLGHPAYDLVSLLEDARRDVDPDIIEATITAFCDAAKIKDDDAFRAAYAVMGAQRNAKILGIFVRLAQRDGKQNYLELLPRVEALFKNNLKHPVMAELSDFLEGLI